MSKQTLVKILGEHAEFYWDHESGKAHCDGCETALCPLTEDMDHQDKRLHEHQADMLIEAGLGLVSEAQAEAWRVGHGAGWNDCLLDLQNGGAKMSENPYED